MSWGFVGGAAINLVGSAIAADAAGDAADTQAAAADRATARTDAQFQQTREDQKPWRDAGIGALNQLNPGTAPGGDFNRDFSLADFQRDPGYQFRLNQGLDAVQGSRAARGSLFSGSTLKALSDYGSNFASAEYGKAYDRFNNDRNQRFNRLASLAGVGQTATNNVGTAGALASQSASNNIIGAGNAQAAGQIGQSNAITGGLSNLQSLYSLNSMNRGGGNPYYGQGTSYSQLSGGTAGDYVNDYMP